MSWNASSFKAGELMFWNVLSFKIGEDFGPVNALTIQNLVRTYVL